MTCLSQMPNNVPLQGIARWLAIYDNKAEEQRRQMTHYGTYTLSGVRLPVKFSSLGHHMGPALNESNNQSKLRNTKHQTKIDIRFGRHLTGLELRAGEKPGINFIVDEGNKRESKRIKDGIYVFLPVTC